jgi:putative ABC transport system permease protein
MSGSLSARDLWQDLRIAVRMMVRTPSVSIPAIVVLALGVGTATALYAVVYAMWLRPLPYPDSGRLVSVTTYFPEFKLDALASPDYELWQGTRSLGPLAAYSLGKATLVAPDETLEVGHARISGNLLQVLRVHAAFGRDIQPADDRPGVARVVLLSEGLWRERFGADRNAVGRSLHIDGEEHTVIGVLPRGFRMPDHRRVDALTPLALGQAWLRHGEGGGMKILRGIARLQPGAGIDRARAELSTRLAASRALAPKLYGDDVSLRILPLHEYVAGDARPLAISLLCSVVCVLIIACANVAGLLVARAAGRGRELAVRVALGASASRIARHLLVDGLVLAAAGIAAGMALAQVFVALLPKLSPATLVQPDAAALDGHVLAVSIAAAVLCSLAFSLAPVLPLPRLRVRRALVAGELALSLVLLVAAALLMESFSKLRSIASGFRTEQLVSASISLRGTRFAENSTELRRELRERLRRTPGVVSLAFADALPPDEAARVTTFSRADRPLPEPFQRGDNAIVRLVDGEYFQTMGIPLRQGRLFSDVEQAGGGLVAVVNQALADRHFAGESVIGKLVDGLGVPWKTVVGVVSDVRNDGLRDPTRPEICLPMTEGNARGGGITRGGGLSIVIRTAGEPAAAVSMLRGHLRAIDPHLLVRAQTMDQRWAELRDGPRFQATVFGGFAALALIMSCTGVYGVASHAVVLRQREIGVRMALGARPLDVQALILRDAAALSAFGLAAGIPGALAGSRFLASLLHGLNPQDPKTIAASSMALLALAICASAAPAWRASRLDPARTLRAE